ncbi:MAG: MATE family efflux transporter, partial [Alphaproteobacteria bacterium]
QHVLRTLRLAGPVIVARCGLLVMVSVDTVMTGRAGAEELAYLAVAYAPQIMMLLIGIGALTGTVVLTAQADGMGRQWECGRIWRVSLVNGTLLGLAWAGVMLLGEDLLLVLGQQPDIARGGGRVLVMFAPGMPAVLMFTATSLFLEGIGRPRAGMVVMIAANLINLGLNWVLIYGHLGLPAMGAAGATLATSLTRWFMVAALAGYALLMRDRSRYGVLDPLAGLPALERKFLRLGAPLAATYGLETAAFTTIAMFAGRLGAVPLAAYQVTLNLMALIFMIAIGLAIATAVRVGNAVGRRDRVGLAAAGWVGVAIAVAIMVVLVLPLNGLAGPIVAFYTDDAAVAAVAVPAVVMAAWILIFDGAQAVLMGALRGAADVWVPTGMYLIAFWCLMVPLGYLLGIEAGHGVQGLMWSILAGTFAATLLLAARFVAVPRRVTRPGRARASSRGGPRAQGKGEAR